jgi:hypothetical protein
MPVTHETLAAIHAKNVTTPKKDPMLVEIHAHDAWKGHINAIQADNLLQGHPPLTYILFQGDSTYQFFISYVDSGQKVKQVPFKIELTIRKWSYRNGTGIVHDDLDAFIPLVLHCRSSQCWPLQ